MRDLVSGSIGAKEKKDCFKRCASVKGGNGEKIEERKSETHLGKERKVISFFVKEKKTKDANKRTTERNGNSGKIGGRIFGIQRDAAKTETNASKFTACEKKHKNMSAFVKKNRCE